MEFRIFFFFFLYTFYVRYDNMLNADISFFWERYYMIFYSLLTKNKKTSELGFKYKIRRTQKHRYKIFKGKIQSRNV